MQTVPPLLLLQYCEKVAVVPAQFPHRRFLCSVMQVRSRAHPDLAGAQRPDHKVGSHHTYLIPQPAEPQRGRAIAPHTGLTRHGTACPGKCAILGFHPGACTMRPA